MYPQREEVKAPLNESFSRAMAYYKALREKSNKDIADALEIPPTTISAWNTGRHLPDMERLQRLATYLNAPIEQFFNFSPESLPNKEISDLQEKLTTDNELVQFLRLFQKLSDEDKHLLVTLAIKINK